MWKKIKPYLIGVLISLGVGALSAFITKDSMNIYETIKKPPLSPPSFLFPVVWGVLFFLMGISSAIVYVNTQKGSRTRKSALEIYALQLIVNFFWSILFFELRAFFFSYVWLLLLFGLILVMIMRFRKIKPISGMLQIPYLIWVTFAGYLNIMIWVLN